MARLDTNQVIGAAAVGGLAVLANQIETGRLLATVAPTFSRQNLERNVKIALAVALPIAQMANLRLPLLSKGLDGATYAAIGLGVDAIGKWVASQVGTTPGTPTTTGAWAPGAHAAARAADSAPMNMGGVVTDQPLMLSPAAGSRLVNQDGRTLLRVDM